MYIDVFPDADKAAEQLAAEIADGLAAANRDGRYYLLGCPGGRSPHATYRSLAVEVAKRRLDLSGLVIVMMDDYVVPGPSGYVPVPTSAHFSVRRYAATEIIEPLNNAAGPWRGIRPDHVWSPDPADLPAYETRLRSGAALDLFILASGSTDGHVAFNPPGTPREAGTRVVDLPESTRRDNMVTFPDFTDLDEVPLHGVTIGVATIAAVSNRAVLIATGSEKQRTVTRLAAAESYDPSWPATIVAACRNSAVYADLEAAGQIPTERIIERAQQ